MTSTEQTCALHICAKKNRHSVREWAISDSMSLWLVQVWTAKFFQVFIDLQLTGHGWMFWNSCHSLRNLEQVKSCTGSDWEPSSYTSRISRISSGKKVGFFANLHGFGDVSAENLGGGAIYGPKPEKPPSIYEYLYINIYIYIFRKGYHNPNAG